MKHKLTNELLEQLANLAKLELTGSDRAELHKGLEQMIAYIDKLSELCTDDTLTLTHFPEFTQHLDGAHPDATDALPTSPLREDIPYHTVHPEQLISLAPKQIDSYYIVPDSLNN